MGTEHMVQFATFVSLCSPAQMGYKSEHLVSQTPLQISAKVTH